MTRCRMTLALVALLAAPGPARAQGAAEPIVAGPAQPSPEETAAKAKPAALGVHGFVQLWATDGQRDDDVDVTASESIDGFLLRRARVKVSHELGPVRFATMIALEHEVVLFDANATVEVVPFAAVTAGQVKLPLSASALTPGTQLRLIDRPLYVYKLHKSTLRDIGVMLHTGRKGLLDGVIRYHVGVFNGGGVTAVMADNDNANALYVGRLLLSTPASLAKGDAGLTVQLGGSFAYSRYPNATKADVTDLLKYRMGGKLGFADSRYAVTTVGADLTVQLYDAYLQLEYLRDSFTGASHPDKQAEGYSAEAAYRLFDAMLQIAARYESFDPDVGAKGERSARRQAYVLGVDVLPWTGVRVSLNAYKLLESKSAFLTAAKEPAGEIDNDMLRLQLQYGF